MLKMKFEEEEKRTHRRTLLHDGQAKFKRCGINQEESFYLFLFQ